ncbi:class I SAM-dependent methyltransferase [Streptomyces mirabilis]|uniref:class I SAM-dependent methyltransferase n=1 Tax=Streptomyces mirabilis TaxID=68239 RepID=UPI00365D5430
MTQIADSAQARAWNGTLGNHWASHHERCDTLVSGLNTALFDAAAIASGDRVLDVGCGAGATTRIAGRPAAHGHAVGVDISAPLLDLARATTAAEGVTDVAYELADAQIHPFPPAGYDVLISRGVTRPEPFRRTSGRTGHRDGDALRPYETDRRVRLRAAVWLVTAKWRTDDSQ